MGPLRGQVLVLLALLLVPAAGSAGPEEQGPAPRLDLHGDPLPDGAVARLGSVRCRHAGMSSDDVFLAGGKTVVTAGSDRVLRFWGVGTGRQVRGVQLQGARAGLGHPLSLSPAGKKLAAFDRDNLVLWDVGSGKEVKRFSFPKRTVAFLFSSPDGKSLAIGSWNLQEALWDAETGKERAVPVPRRRIGVDSTFHAHFSPDGKWFVVGGGWGSPLAVLKTATWHEAYRLNCNAYTSAVSPDNNKRLVVCSMKGDRGGRGTVLRLFDLASGKEEKQFPLGTEGSYTSLAFSPDGKLLACGFSDRSCVVDLTTGRVLHRLSGRPIGMSFSPDGKLLAASTGRRLRFWDVERHRWPLPVAMTDAGGNTFVHRLLLSPAGRRAFTALADGTCLVWDLTPALRRCEPLVRRPGEKEMAGWWADLAGVDAGRAYGAGRRLTEAPEAAAFLRRRVKPVTGAELWKARPFIAELDSDSFEVRRKANKELEALGGAALPALREALAAKTSAEVRRRLETLLSHAAHSAASPEVLRRLRAILVLEQLASKEARGLLAELAEGVPYAAETREAKDALERLNRWAAQPFVVNLGRGRPCSNSS